MQWARELAAQALALSSQDWTSRGFSSTSSSDDPQVSVGPTSNLTVITERIVSLLAIRTVAILSSSSASLASSSLLLDDHFFEDLSTTTICRTLLLNTCTDWSSNNSKWPSALTEEVVQEMRAYVKRILQGYNDVPYHSREHAFHVVLSANKLLDLMLLNNTTSTNTTNPETHHHHHENGHERHTGTSTAAAAAAAQDDGDQGTTTNYDTIGTAGPRHNGSTQQRPPRVPNKSACNTYKTFGLRRDAMLHFTLLFAALIHDVQHGGISNRQLSTEDDPISLLYNDSSCLEQQSLTIAFTELLQPEFAQFRKVLFPTREMYVGFRKTVVNLVLATDIANPERMQITKDKWKTAFGDVSNNNNNNNNNNNTGTDNNVTATTTTMPTVERARRESGITEITLPRHNLTAGKESRRRSIESMYSDMTEDHNLHNTNSCAGDEVSLSGSLDSYDDDDIILDAPSDTAKNGGTSSTHRVVSSKDLGYLPVPPPQASASTKEQEENGGRTPTKSVEGADTTLAVSQTSSSAPIMRVRQQARNSDGSRRGSTASVPEGMAAGYALKRGSMLRQRRASIAVGGDLMKRLQRRISATSSTKTASDLVNTKKFRQRLGIMRSVDLGGETIENFTRKASLCTGNCGGASVGAGSLEQLKHLEDYDEPDELRATVVLETMLLCSDVAHNIQSWDHSLKWSHRLYWELLDANKSGRGFDPSSGWCGGQAGFLQNYMLPLAQKLGNTGVFGHQTGQIFVQGVIGIIDTWEDHGEEVTLLLMNNREIDMYPFR